MNLSELLKKENNNLDVFRLVAACMVIYGHAYAVAPQAGRVDAVARLLGHDYSGSLAVKIFFFLSGLVVTNSLLQKRNVVHFAIARFFRIWPALIFVTVVSALLLGPFVTALSLARYFSQGQLSDYRLLDTNYSLPGLLEESGQNRAQRFAVTAPAAGARLSRPVGGFHGWRLAGWPRWRWLLLADPAPLAGNRPLST